MKKDEKRLCRRELINFCLQTNFKLSIVTKLILLKGFVREYEKKHYGKELKSYG